MCVNNDNFTALVSWGGSLHAVSHCIQNDWTSNESASNFVLSLNIPPWTLFGCFRRLKIWATGDWKLHHDNMSTHASRLVQSFFEKYQITQVTQPLYSSDLAPCDFWIFPKLKSPLKGKRFQTVDEIQENTTGQLMVIGRTVGDPKMPTLKGTVYADTFCQTSIVWQTVTNLDLIYGIKSRNWSEGDLPSQSE